MSCENMLEKMKKALLIPATEHYADDVGYPVGPFLARGSVELLQAIPEPVDSLFMIKHL